ncbi:MAG TPA: PIN domain-containing protein, partial [Solirubrobacterales bacterium]|nr:PIN domain-containing protein [Solirubrobacterales bacterium]
MESLALDASAAIALFSEADAHHARAVVEFEAAVERGDAMSMAASAYSEIMVHALRRRRGDLVDRFVDRLQIEIIPADRDVARSAAELRAQHGALRLPDALVAATARVRGARLLTFDERLAQL